MPPKAPMTIPAMAPPLSPVLFDGSELELAVADDEVVLAAEDDDDDDVWVDNAEDDELTADVGSST